jgi:transposase
MEQYVGLDVSQDLTHVCVVDRDGKTLWQGDCESTPEAIGATIKERAPTAVRIGLESGNFSTWHWHGLTEMGLPAICIDAYHAHGVLKLQMNKTDKNDAHGLAQIMRCGWYKPVKIKSFESHESRALFRVRSNLVTMRTDVVNSIRGTLRTFGILIKGVAGVKFETRVEEIIKEGGALADPLRALLDVLRVIKKQIEELDEKVLDYAWGCQSCQLLMSIPGVGPVTAAKFVLAVDDAGRFKKSKNVAAYFGLTPRRRQSGEMDYNGRISKRGDSVVRHHLYEAANVLLTRVKKPSALQAWGLRIAKRSGMKKARIAVARKLAVIMHQMLLTDEFFCPFPADEGVYA